MESDEEKQATHSTAVATPCQHYHVHFVYALCLVAIVVFFQYQLADVRAQVEFLSLRALEEGRQNVTAYVVKTQNGELSLSSSVPDDSRSRHKRSAAARTNSTRHRSPHKHMVASQFSIDKEHLTEAQMAEKTHGVAVNYSGPNLKWHETGLSWPTKNHLDADNTSVTVPEDGIYLVYAQLTYFNSAAKSSFRVETDNRTLLKCFQSVDNVSEKITGSDGHRVKTCFSSGLFALKFREKLRLVNLSSRAIMVDIHANFWGLIKLHDSHDG